MSSNKLYEFGPYHIDPARRLLTRAGEPVQVAPKTLDLLLVLVNSRGRLLSKSELLHDLWPDTIVEEASLAFQISNIRKIFGSDGAAWIQTVPKHGYRFIAEVREYNEPEGQPAVSSAPNYSISARISQDRRSARSRWVAVVATAVAVAFTTWWLARPRSSEARPELVRLTADSGLNTDPTISTDGRLLAYASDRSHFGDLDIWVLPLAGGEPIRITDDKSDDHEPAFSPDGSQIVFRSERDGGGVHVVPALGGQAHLLAKYGRRPRFSPNGAWVAYWVGFTGEGHLQGRGTGKIFVVPATGGTPRQVQPEFASARYPVWSSDGDALLFAGSREAGPRSALSTSPAGGSWYVARLTGGEAEDTEAVRLLDRDGLSPPNEARQIVPADWRDDRVVFAASAGNSANLWEIVLSSKTRKAVGRPRRLSFGADLEVQPAFGPSLKAGAERAVVFASVSSNIDMFVLPRDVDRSSAASQLRRITEAPSAEFVQALSKDGKKLLFLTDNSGKREFWMKDIDGGRESRFVVTPGANRAKFSGDGNEVAYGVPVQDRSILVVPTTGGVPRRLCDNCASHWDAASDWKWILYIAGGDPTYVEALDTLSGRRNALLRDDNRHLYEPKFSADDRWVAFMAREQPDRLRIYVAPFRPDSVVQSSEWIAITDGATWDDGVRWSVEGDRLYFISERDGFRCIWAQNLRPDTKHPAGPPFAVYHSHQARLSIMNVNWGAGTIAIARDRIAFGQGELTGNIWMAKLPF